MSSAVLRQVREHPQLDLRVVGGEDDVPRRRDEGGADGPAELRADGDVLQVRVVRRQPAGGGDGLVEARVDAAGLGVHVARQRVDVRALELVELAVLQDRLGQAGACRRGPRARRRRWSGRPWGCASRPAASGRRRGSSRAGRASARGSRGPRSSCTRRRGSRAAARRPCPSFSSDRDVDQHARASPSPRARAPAASRRRASARRAPRPTRRGLDALAQPQRHLGERRGELRGPLELDLVEQGLRRARLRGRVVGPRQRDAQLLAARAP